MQDNDGLAIEAIEHAARWLDDLPVTGPLQLLGPGAALGVVGKLLDVTENAAHELGGGDRILNGNVVGDRIEVADSRLRPDYLNHRASRAFACS